MASKTTTALVLIVLVRWRDSKKEKKKKKKNLSAAQRNLHAELSDGLFFLSLGSISETVDRP